MEPRCHWCGKLNGTTLTSLSSGFVKRVIYTLPLQQTTPVSTI
jgi:hypothetical protein